MQGPMPPFKKMQSAEKKGSSFSKHFSIFFLKEGFKTNMKRKSQRPMIRSSWTFLQQIPPHRWMHRAMIGLDFS